MKTSGIFILTIFCLLSTACTTMSGLKESKKEFQKGDFLAGTWTGLMSLTLLPIVDVFTLGGSMDAEQSKEVWTGAAKEYNKQKEINDANEKKRRESILQKQRIANSQNNMVLANNNDQSTSGNGSVNTSIPTSTQSIKNATSEPVKCVSSSKDSKNHSIKFYNGCSKTVTIGFCYTKSSSSREQYLCHAQDNYWSLSKIDYKTQSITLQSGQTYNVAENYQNLPQSIAWIGCATPYIIPIMDSPKSGYCRTPQVHSPSD